MNLCSNWDISHRHTIPGLDRRRGARNNLRSGRHSLWCNDVPAITVFVENQGNVRGAIRVVLQSLDDAGHPRFIALIIDHTRPFFVAAPDVTTCDATLVIASAGLGFSRHQGRVRTAFMQPFRFYSDYETRTG